MTKADLVEIVYEKIGGLSKKESQDIVEAIFETMKGCLKQAKRSRFPASAISLSATRDPGKAATPRPATISRLPPGGC